MTRQIIGRYIVADSKICHGKPTVRGTRILVEDVLYFIAKGRDWESISLAWDGSVSVEAIAEIAGLAKQAFLDHANEYVVETIPA